MNLCKNCKHFYGRGDCQRWQYVEPVNGEVCMPWITARNERDLTTHYPGFNTKDPCGPDGKHWEAAPPAPAPAIKAPWWRRIRTSAPKSPK